jgi:hypothetical protein
MPVKSKLFNKETDKLFLTTLGFYFISLFVNLIFKSVLLIYLVVLCNLLLIYLVYRKKRYEIIKRLFIFSFIFVLVYPLIEYILAPQWGVYATSDPYVLNTSFHMLFVLFFLVPSAGYITLRIYDRYDTKAIAINFGIALAVDIFFNNLNAMSGMWTYAVSSPIWLTPPAILLAEALGFSLIPYLIKLRNHLGSILLALSLGLFWQIFTLII